MTMQTELLNKMAWFRHIYRVRRANRWLGDPEEALRRWRYCYNLLHQLTNVGGYLPR